MKKKHPVIEQKPMIWVTTRKMMKPMVMAKMKPVAISSISTNRDIKIRGNLTWLGRVKIIAIGRVKIIGSQEWRGIGYNLCSIVRSRVQAQSSTSFHVEYLPY